MISLRPYQTTARHRVNALLNASRSPVFVSPTGTGKTLTATAIIADRIRLKRRVYVLVPQVEIFEQWVSSLARAGLNPGTIADGKVSGASRWVYVVMPLTLVNMLSMVPEAIYPDELVFDECHHTAAATMQEIIRFFPRATPWGLTATPARTDHKPLSPPFTDIVQTITMRQAIDAGFLARPLPVVPEILLGKVPIKNGEYDPQAQAAALGKTQIIGNVIDNYGTVFGGLPVLVACSTFDHAKDMTARFNEAGWRFEHIHSGLVPAERKRMLRQIRERRLNGLCTVGIGIEGMDIPGLYGLIWLRRTMSLTIYLQFIGRVLRPLPGKTHGIIIDPVGNLFIHGFPEADREWSLAATEPTKAVQDDIEAPNASVMRICPFCGVANAAMNTRCHFCGKELDSEEARQARARTLPAMVDGELVAVESDGQAEAIRERAERIRAEQAARFETERQAEERRRTEAQEITVDTAEQVRTLREGLFTTRRRMFAEAVKNYL